MSPWLFHIRCYPCACGSQQLLFVFCYSQHKDIYQEIRWSFYSQTWSIHGEIRQQEFPLQSRAYPLLAKTCYSLGCEEVSLSKIYSGVKGLCILKEIFLTWKEYLYCPVRAVHWVILSSASVSALSVHHFPPIDLFLQIENESKGSRLK